MTGQDTSEISGEAYGDIRDDLKNIERLKLRSYVARMFTLLGTGTFFNGFDTAMIGSVIPALIIVLHMSIIQVGNVAASAFIGAFVGALTFGIISETYGRKVAYIVSILEYGIFGIATGLASTYVPIYALRLISGFGIGGETIAASALITEFVPTMRRGFMVVAYESLYAWGIFIAPLASAGIFSIFGLAVGWRVVFFLLAIPVTAGLISIFALWESPRWLLQRGKTNEARVIINKMEKRAKSDKLDAELAEVDRVIDNTEISSKPTKYGELFSKQYRKRTGFNWVMWFTFFFINYGVFIWLPEEYTSIGHLPASLSLALTAATGGISVVIIYVVVMLTDRVGRKPIFITGYCVALAGLIFGLVEALVYHDVQWSVLFVVSTLAFAASAGLGVTSLYVYTGELFPTRMRAWALSAGNAILWLAGIVGVETVGLILAAGHSSAIGVGYVFLTFIAVAIVGLIITAVYGIETKQKILENLSP